MRVGKLPGASFVISTYDRDEDDDLMISPRLIVALDVPTGDQALDLARQLRGSVDFFKVGLELLSSGDGLKVIDQLADRGHRVFADFKFLDIPQTVYRAVRNLNDRGITFLTVHAEPQTMQAALDAADDTMIMAVTVLTSLNDEALSSMGINMNAEELVRLRAIQARQAGCAGVISSPREIRPIRESAGRDLLIVTPGIRESEAPADDQKRTMSIEEALEAGADFFVVGRPVRDAADPWEAAMRLQNTISRFEQSELESIN